MLSILTSHNHNKEQKISVLSLSQYLKKKSYYVLFYCSLSVISSHSQSIFFTHIHLTKVIDVFI